MGKYWKVFALSCHHTWKNKKALLGLIFLLLICILIFANLWELIAKRGDLTSMNAKELLWYIALNQWVLFAIPRSEQVIERDFRSGKLAYLIPRPISYLGYVFAEGCGAGFVNLGVLGVFTYIFTWGYVGTITLSSWNIILSIICALFAVALGTLFKMIIGLLAFWMHDVDPIAWIWEKLLFTLGGLLLPLSAYPPAWNVIAKFTPFYYILGGRSALTLDNGPLVALTIVSGLVIWVCLGGLITILMYRRGLKIIAIGGG